MRFMRAMLAHLIVLVGWCPPAELPSQGENDHDGRAKAKRDGDRDEYPTGSVRVAWLARSPRSSRAHATTVFLPLGAQPQAHRTCSYRESNSCGPRHQGPRQMAGLFAFPEEATCLTPVFCPTAITVTLAV